MFRLGPFAAGRFVNKRTCWRVRLLPQHRLYPAGYGKQPFPVKPIDLKTVGLGNAQRCRNNFK